MKKAIHILLFAHLLYFCSCEKQTNITSNQCPDLIQNVITDDFPMDSYGVNKVEVIEEELHVNVTYGGGCEDHEFKLVMEPVFCGTPPVYYYLQLSHDSNNDVCEALILEHNLCFNISELLSENFSDEVFLFFQHPDSLYDLN